MPTRTGEPTATELLEQLASGETSSRELAARCLERIERAAPLNAVAHVDPERVLADAEAADRARATRPGKAGSRTSTGRDDGIALPLLGLPVSIKDSIDVAGLPCCCGSFARAEHVPERDATVVARLRAAGAIVLCKTAVPEYTWSVETDSALMGATRNPYDPERAAGGSSGGEAVLHALDASPVGVGSDGLNSIRVPAHFCGTVGLRPTTGLIPETGAWPTTKDTGMLDMSTLGPMGRSVDDLALLLPLLAGPDDVDPLANASPVLDHRTVEIEQLRVGFYVDDGVSTATAGTREAVERAATALAAAGAVVEAVTPPSLSEVPDLAFRMMAADGGAQARADLGPAAGRHTPQVAWLLEGLKPFAVTAEEYFALVRRWIGLRSELRRFVRRHDLVVCPVAAGPAPRHGRRPSDDGELTDYGDYTHSFAYAIAGTPSVSVPAGTEGGLPVGVQVIAPAFADHVALAVAAFLEQELATAVPVPPYDRGGVSDQDSRPT